MTFKQNIFNRLFSSPPRKEDLIQSNSTSIYTAFTDLNCYDYRKLIHKSKQNYLSFLNTYRYRSPFPIYVSIIKSNGPTCHPFYSNSSCATYPKAFFPHLIRQLCRFIRFWLIISIPFLICIIIYKNCRSRTKPKSSPVKQTIQLEQKPVIIKYPLDKNLENQFRLWLEQEKNSGYQNLSEIYRNALNTTYSKQYVSHLI